MIADIFSNIAIITAFLFLTGQLFKGYKLENRLPFRVQLTIGSLFGLLGFVLLFYRITITDIAILDLRNFATIGAAIIAGPVAAVVAAVIAGLSRGLLRGVNVTFYISWGSALLIAGLCAFTVRTGLTRFKKFSVMLLLSLAVTNLALLYSMDKKDHILQVLPYIWAVYLMAAIPVYFTLDTVINGNTGKFRRLKIEQELRLSDAKFRAIFENAGIGISLRDLDGRTIDVNPYYLDILGYSKKEEVNFEDIFYPEDLPKELEIFKSITEGKLAPYRLERRYRSANGRTVYCDVISSLIPGSGDTPAYVLSAAADITHRKRLEDTIRESEMRFRSAFDNAAVGMCLLSLDGKFLRVNETLCGITGYTADELALLSLQEIIHKESIDEDVDFMVRLLNSEIQHFHKEMRIKCKDGREIWVILSASVISDVEGNAQHYIGQVQDITARKQVEGELIRAKTEAEKTASTDYLTGILNRRAFMERFNEEFIRVNREKSSISLILIDIDHFKIINDTYGHQIGDLVLQKFTKCISKACRPYDFMGRHGGEEFIICLPNTNLQQALKIAERMRAAVENMSIPLVYLKYPINITASFGVASPITGYEESIDTLIIQADKAMYRAKSGGRNKVAHNSSE